MSELNWVEDDQGNAMLTRSNRSKMVAIVDNQGWCLHDEDSPLDVSSGTETGEEGRRAALVAAHRLRLVDTVDLRRLWSWPAPLLSPKIPSLREQVGALTADRAKVVSRLKIAELAVRGLSELSPPCGIVDCAHEIKGRIDALTEECELLAGRVGDLVSENDQLRDQERELTAKLAYWIDRARSSNRRPLTYAEEEEAERYG